MDRIRAGAVLKTHWPLCLAILGGLAGLVLLPWLPAQMTVQWSWNLAPGSYLPKYGAVFCLPAVGAAVYVGWRNASYSLRPNAFLLRFFLSVLAVLLFLAQLFMLIFNLAYR